MIRWKTLPNISADDALKHGSHNQKLHGRDAGGGAGGGISTTYQTALEVARRQGKSEAEAQLFAERADEIARSAPLIVNEKTTTDKHYELLKQMNKGEYNDDEYYSMESYYMGNSWPINAILRGKKDEVKWIAGPLDPEAVKKTTSDLDSLTNGQDRVPENMMVVRGISMREKDFANFKVGAVVSDKAYMSTSIDASYAEKFSSTETKKGRLPIMMNIRVPAGHPAVYCDSVFQEYKRKNRKRLSGNIKKNYTPELSKGEMVFSRNTNILIRGMELRNGVWYVDAEVIPSN